MTNFLEKERETLLVKVAKKVGETLPVPELLEAPIYTKRRPLGKQKEAIDALYTGFKRGKRVLFLSGKEGEGIGVGKTYISIAVASALLYPKGRVLVIAPAHLVEKWCDEVRGDGFTALVPGDGGELLALLKEPPKGLEFLILSKDRAKRTFAKRPIALSRCPDCGAPVEEKDQGKICRFCGGPLWQKERGKGRSTPLGEVLQKAESLDMVLLDEGHNFRHGETLQAQLASHLASTFPTLIISGTLMGGFASELYHLLALADPETVRRLSTKEFVEAFGAFLEVEKTAYTSEGKTLSHRKATEEAPGFNPTLLGLVMPSAYFIGLRDVENLPPFKEKIHILPTSERQHLFLGALKEALDGRSGPRDVRWGSLIMTALLGIDLPGVEFLDTPRGRVLLPPLPHDELLPKEALLLSLISLLRARGEKVIVYVQGTGVWDIQPRLWGLLRDDGHEALVLTAQHTPEERYRLLKERAPDILITNPKLVETGLDLLEYSAAIFYQPPLSAYTLRQAARRIYRLGQKKKVSLFYLAYEGVQESLLSWTAEKVRQSVLFEGGFAPEGLEFGLGENPLEVVAKALAGEIRKWRGESVMEGEVSSHLPPLPELPELPEGRWIKVGRKKVYLPKGQKVLF